MKHSILSSPYLFSFPCGTACVLLLLQVIQAHSLPHSIINLLHCMSQLVSLHLRSARH